MDRHGDDPMVSGASGQPRSVVLVEGVSDRIAGEVAAGILGRDRTAEGLPVLPMGGSTNLRHHLEMLSHRLDVRVTVLGDEREAPRVQRELRRFGHGSAAEVCVADLEDELIRALGPAPGSSRGRSRGPGGRKILYARLLTAALEPASLPAPLVALLHRV